MLRKVRKQIPLEESDKIPEVQPEPIVSNICVVIAFIWLFVSAILGCIIIAKTLPIQNDRPVAQEKISINSYMSGVEAIKCMYSLYGYAWHSFDDSEIKQVLTDKGYLKYTNLTFFRRRTYFEYSDLSKALDVFGLVSICQEEKRLSQEQLACVVENLDNADEKQLRLVIKELERQRRLLLFPSLIDDVVCAIRWFLEAVIIWIFIYLLFFNKRKMSSAKSQKSDNFQNGDL